VRIEGKTEKIIVANDNLIIKISEYSRIFVLEDIASNILVEEGDIVSVAGVLKIFRGEKEIEVVSISGIRALSE
jgi:DNA/RNA endonuclease YhcR with UshA esterase domain